MMKKLNNAENLLSQRYGKKGTKSRAQFRESSFSFYYGEILKTRRKELNLSQEELAFKIGKKRPYISRVENGEDLKISNLLQIATALGLTLDLKVA